MDLLNLIREARTELGKGSQSGRQKMLSGKSGGNPHTKSQKSRVKVYDSITDALKKGYVGQIFSTKDADRLYVITKRKWGKDDEQMVGGRVAKGFSQGSIPSTFSDVKQYAVRTMVRHGRETSKKMKGKPYWKGNKKLAGSYKMRSINTKNPNKLKSSFLGAF